MKEIEYIELLGHPKMKISLTNKEVLIIGERIYQAVNMGGIKHFELSALPYTCLMTYLSTKEKKICRK